MSSAEFLPSMQSFNLCYNWANTKIAYDAKRTKKELMQFADNAGPDQGLRYPLTESIVVYVDEQKMPRTDCNVMQAYLDLRCPRIA